MLDAISRLTYDVVQAYGGYAPHAVCLLQDPAIIAIQVVTNLAIAAAYFMIPFSLARFVRLMPSLPFRSVVVMFLVFILACGTSHLTHIMTLFFGGWAYWVDSAVAAVTAVASLGTAIGLIRHGPSIVTLMARRLAQPA
jgi:hypothetical protein